VPFACLTGVLMVLAASCEFDKRLNSEIVERPSDNEEIPEVSTMHWLVYYDLDSREYEHSLQENILKYTLI